VKHTHALLISYDGAAFSGFQRQPPMITVQGELERALESLELRVRVEGAGRTDAGVHARRQVITFRTRAAVPADLATRLARRLPRALAVLRHAPAGESFHARFSAVAKVYRYRVIASPDPTPWESSTGWVLPDLRGFPDLAGPVLQLDEAPMRAALEALHGRHDFTALSHPRGEGKRVRLLARVDLQVRPAARAGHVYELTLAAPGFLRHQVRNLAGLVTSAGLGRFDPAGIPALLTSGERWRGPRAPARGLTLWDVQYREAENPLSRT
jgi:tRNA pseudouridine38-40 synthase